MVLRVSELANVDIKDIDLDARTIRVREGKGDRYGIAYITQDCANMLRDYLEIRQQLPIESQALFLTEQGRWWDHLSLSRMVRLYKLKAGIRKPGSAHALARHVVASILIKNGASLLMVQNILRHKDIESTARYIHLSNTTKQAQHDRYLKI